MAAQLELRDVVAGYDQADVLSGVSLEVDNGRITCLLGANGAGKTTLLKILATLCRPSRGSASVAGHDCAREAEQVRRHVALVAHGSYLYDDLSAAENLTFWARLAGATVSGADVGAALASVELDRMAHERIRTFSAGMRRRLSLARLLLVRPRVLLLDEPFASLDQQAKKWLEEYLQAFKAHGGALVMTSHSFGRELNVADRVAVLAGGRIAFDAPRVGLAAEEIQRLYSFHAEDQP
jgi:heme ABC exporter ATP-binding subunit CcmA